MPAASSAAAVAASRGFISVFCFGSPGFTSGCFTEDFGSAGFSSERVVAGFVSLGLSTGTGTTWAGTVSSADSEAVTVLVSGAVV